MAKNAKSIQKNNVATSQKKDVKRRNKNVQDVENGKKNVSEEEVVKVVGKKMTLTAMEAISDDEEEEGVEEWSAEAKALRQAISEGVFDKIGLHGKDDEEGTTDLNDKADTTLKETESGDDDDTSLDDRDDDDEESLVKHPVVVANSNPKALRTVTLELETAKASLLWAETFDIIAPTPLPFSGKRNSDESLVVDVHDDLKREMAFYNLSLEAVHKAKVKCAEANIPFTRPEDFFAEMVKTDDHMAKVKDRLIFETKKMDAFEQRKSNKEQKLRSKEAHAHRISEKFKSKKYHMKAVEDWANSAASNRVGGGRVRDEEEDDNYLDKMNGSGNKRRAADRKYGHGGKRGRFKQNDVTFNDDSKFNPRAGGTGPRKINSSISGKRKGKRARDAAKSKRY